MSVPVIKIENLCKNFGDLRAVDKIDLEVNEGEIIGLVGPNGAGKTTTIKMIAKLLRPNSGKILLKNKQGELQDLRWNSRNLIETGFLIDVPAFYDMSANNLLRYFALLRNYPRSKIDKRIDELLFLFKLSKWKYEKVSKFSKGMKQKLGIAQALIHKPTLIILDEPQTGLDPKARIEIREFLKYLQDQGKTIFVASHLLYEISEICNKIALINHGKIIGFDTIDNLEKTLKRREIECEVLEPISPENLGNIIKRLTSTLDPYLDKDLDPKISKIPIKYVQEEQMFKIYYEGTKEVRAKILKILINEFDSTFSVVSYTRPRTSQLEDIYSQMITEDDEKFNNQNGGRNK